MSRVVKSVLAHDGYVQYKIIGVSERAFDGHQKKTVDMKCSPLQQRPPSSPPPLQYKDLGQHEAGTHYHGPIVNFLNIGM